MSANDLQELMLETLAVLVRLKEYKEEHGKDEYYLETMPELWKHSKVVLELCESQMPTSETDKALGLFKVVHSAVNIENFLKENDFQLDTFYKTNKKYRKQITDCQTLYVRIYSDANKIVDVEYEHKSLTNFENGGIISFETIEKIEQLKHLLKALS